jgi:hypothetical protein
MNFFWLLADPLLYRFYDPHHHTNESPFGEASGVVTDDVFIVRFHKEGEGMPALRLLPEYGG